MIFKKENLPEEIPIFPLNLFFYTRLSGRWQAPRSPFFPQADRGSEAAGRGSRPRREAAARGPRPRPAPTSSRSPFSTWVTCAGRAKRRVVRVPRRPRRRSRLPALGPGVARRHASPAETCF